MSMAMYFRPTRLPAAVLGVAALILPNLYVTASAQTPARRPLITEAVNEARLQALPGNTRPEVRTQTDQGPVSDSLALDHMLLQLQRPAEQTAELDAYVEALHNPASPYFHKWLTAAEIGEKYGPAEADVAAVTGWLESHGFTVNGVSATRMQIDFSGNAGQVREAFHTELHSLESGGKVNVANMSDPRIPAALAPAVAGVVSLHSFRPRTMTRRRPDYTFKEQGTTTQALVPADLATIYNLNALFAKGLTGKGQTIAVLEDSDLYNSADWTTFRKTFGLSTYTSGSLTTVHPAPASGANNCADPGVARGASAGDDEEAILDVEWASAAAPNAAIQMASCASTQTTFGGYIALQNLLSSSKPPTIVSVSYGDCESDNGAAANKTIATLYQQAVTMGISVFASAGDEGAAGCDSGSSATHGIAVSAYASTPYNVAVGGTDFSDTLDGTTGTYWNSTNSSTYASAKRYIPEIPWNDSCAGGLLAGYYGYTVVYGANGFCNTRTASVNGFLAVSAGSGGPSACATGTPTVMDVVGGSCQGYAKPTWQSGVAGIPADGVRDLPDVSLFAADGVWGHYYVYCWSNVREGGASCAGAPSTWSGAGGTSFATPIMAGIQALVNQSTGSLQGNPNYVYYKLAATSGYTCDASGGDTGNCIFHMVSRGDIAVNCTGTIGCYGSSTTTAGRSGPFGRFATSSIPGALSTRTSSYSAAYAATKGWNFAVGNGSVNAYNLVTLWSHGQ
jgi:subtilase family serine protease